MDVQKREDRLLDAMKLVMDERDKLQLENQNLREELFIAVEAALVVR